MHPYVAFSLSLRLYLIGAAAAAGNWKLDADDGQGQGLGLTSSSRAMLMAKLGQSAGLAVPTPVAPAAAAAATAAPVVAAAAIPGDPSAFLMIANMFDPAAEAGDDWELDIKEDVMEECAKHGPVLHVHVETKKPGGIVLLKFAAADGAMKAARSLNGRFFAQRQITCAFLQETVYKQLLLDD